MSEGQRKVLIVDRNAVVFAAAPAPAVAAGWNMEVDRVVDGPPLQVT